MRKIFYIIITIVLLALLGLGLIFRGTFFRSSREIGINNASAAETIQTLELESFEQIGETQYLMARVSVPRTKIVSIPIRSGGIYQGGEVLNIIFLDSETLTSHRLFETNEAVILRVSEYPESRTGTAGYSPLQDNEVVTQWLIYQVIKSDSNGDEVQDKDDLMTIAVSDVTGQNYTELLKGISKLNSMTMVKNWQLIVVYQDENGDNNVTTLDLQERIEVGTEKIIDIEDEIKEN